MGRNPSPPGPHGGNWEKPSAFIAAQFHRRARARKLTMRTFHIGGNRHPAFPEPFGTLEAGATTAFVKFVDLKHVEGRGGNRHRP